MSTEIERKFLIKDLTSVNKIINNNEYKIENIIQFYIGENDYFSNRIRIINKEKAEITIKSKESELSRYEMNQEISVKEAIKMMEINKEPIIEKQRIKLTKYNYDIDIDIFGGHLKGLIMAEIEFDSVEKAHNFYMDEIPEFYQEVTGEKKYINSQLIINKEKQKKEKLEKDLSKLTKLYTIEGDGVARLIMEEAVKDEDFRRTVKNLSKMKIKGDK